jgi:hypothetical protein
MASLGKCLTVISGSVYIEVCDCSCPPAFCPWLFLPGMDPARRAGGKN